MTYQEFREIVKVQIRDFLPPNLSNAEISINEVIKNNHVKLYGLIIKDPEERMVPTIYLEPYYQKYEAEMDMGRILQSLVAQYEQSKDRGKDILPFSVEDYEQVKDRLYLIVLNQDNQEYLKETVHQDIPETNLTAVIRVLCGEMKDQSIGSFAVKESLLSMWDRTKEQVYEQALANTERFFPARLMNVMDVIQNLALQVDERKEEGENSIKNLLPYEQYVLSNTEKFHGATAILYPGLLQEIGEATKSSFFLLPSSLHEVILMKDNGEMSAEELQRMVMQINRTEVKPEEVLSDEVYCYDYREQKLTMATDPVKTKEVVQQMEGMEGQENVLEEERAGLGIDR
ncbi:MAG: DUF5688 family protein [Lachnospiraceae bacterium]|nr:DUF5688 family protein [Lachnospiraceae bacterium]MDY3221833.1 DUF5688 family protein [Lachnospiraceae bacterium]